MKALALPLTKRPRKSAGESGEARLDDASAVRSVKLHPN
jgi:hypothetical protein